jgi:hypothetical protein
MYDKATLTEFLRIAAPTLDEDDILYIVTMVEGFVATRELDKKPVTVGSMAV